MMMRTSPLKSEWKQVRRHDWELIMISYVVEDIVGHSWEKVCGRWPLTRCARGLILILQGGILYEVKWENYSYEENTHEPEENLE